MIKVGVFGATGRVGKLLIEDLHKTEGISLSSAQPVSAATISPMPSPRSKHEKSAKRTRDTSFWGAIRFWTIAVVSYQNPSRATKR